MFVLNLHILNYGCQFSIQQIESLPSAQGVDRRVVRVALDAEVAAVVVGVAIAIVLAVGLVVPVLVGHGVAQGEPVVCGNEIYACARSSPTGLEHVRRPVHALREFAARTLVAAPEAAHTVAETIVPFRPPRWKITELVSARAGIPGLGNQLGVAQARVVADVREQRVRG